MSLAVTCALKEQKKPSPLGLEPLSLPLAAPPGATVRLKELARPLFSRLQILKVPLRKANPDSPPPVPTLPPWAIKRAISIGGRNGSSPVTERDGIVLTHNAPVPVAVRLTNIPTA